MSVRQSRPTLHGTDDEAGVPCTVQGVLVFSRRSLTIFASALAVTLLAGVAFAQVGSFTPDAPDAGDINSEAAAFSSAPTQELDGSTVPLSQFEDSSAEEVAEDSTTPGSLADRGPATLVILHPLDGDRFEEKTITFTGVAPIGWTVSAAGYAATMDGAGNWSIDLILWPGANPATITATSPDGEVQTARVTAYYDVPEADSPPPTDAPSDGDHDEPRDAMDFTARQVFGESTDKNPTEVIVGTAPAGTTIYAVSAYASTTAVADDRGRWEVRLTFVEPPIDQPFEIVIEADTGARAVFEFVRRAPSGENGDHDRAEREREREREDRPRDRDRPRERPPRERP